MRTRSLLSIAFVLIITSVFAQVEIKEISGAGQKKFKNASKEVYIGSFRVIYQLLYSQSERAEGGRELGGGYRGDAVAGLNMALKGLSESDLMEVTDKLYNEYTGQLKRLGFSIMESEAAEKSDLLEGWTKKEGGTMNEDQFPGLLTTIPTGFNYYIRTTTSKGKEKGFINPFKLSADLGGAVVNHVTIVVPFIIDAESGASKALTKGLGGMAKIVVKPDLRIESESMGYSSFGNVAQTNVTFNYAPKRIKPEAGTNMHLKKSIDIPGIIEEKKYKSSESAEVDNWGSDYGALKVFNVSDAYLSKTHAIEVDPKLYKDAVYTAGNSYLTKVIDLFGGYANR